MKSNLNVWKPGLSYKLWKELSNVISNVSIKTGLTFENAKNMKFGNQFWLFWLAILVGNFD
jgi:hypothetical protein